MPEDKFIPFLAANCYKPDLDRQIFITMVDEENKVVDFIDEEFKVYENVPFSNVENCKLLSYVERNETIQ